MWSIRKTFRFEAAHKLPQHDGKCARLHGHSWVMHITLEHDRVFETGPQAGMVMDFGRLKEVVRPLIEKKLDHHYLNETLPVYPTSENIARWVAEEVRERLRRCTYDWPKLVSVTIEETCTSAATYTAE